MAPFHHGVVVVFAVAAGLSVLAALASLSRGGRHVDPPAPAGNRLHRARAGNGLHRAWTSGRCCPRPEARKAS